MRSLLDWEFLRVAALVLAIGLIIPITVPGNEKPKTGLVRPESAIEDLEYDCFLLLFMS